jgi:hypothetical protein
MNHFNAHMNHFKDIKISSKHIIFYTITTKFDFPTEEEACASPLSTSMRKNLDFLRRVRHVPHPKNTNSKHRILFHKGEACASPLSTSLRRNSDFSRRVRHVPHPKKTNSKHRILLHKGEVCASSQKKKFKT